MAEAPENNKGTEENAEQKPAPKKPAPKQRKKVATAKNPTIEAALNGLYRLETPTQAKDKVETLKEFFIISAEQQEDQTIPSVRLWIKGYDVTDQERDKGFLGNVALIKVEEVGEGEDVKYTLKATKEEVPLKNHPQRKRPKQKHPDWGHPIMRQIKKGAVYKDVEEPRELLMKLHEEYPDISIPLTNKIYIIVYSKASGKKPPIEKYVLEIKVAEKGGFFIDSYVNTYERQGPPKKTQGEVPTAEESEEALKKDAPGKFASMVALKKKPPTSTGNK